MLIDICSEGRSELADFHEWMAIAALFTGWPA
jgi:hypothetical protein